MWIYSISFSSLYHLSLVTKTQHSYKNELYWFSYLSAAFKRYRRNVRWEIEIIDQLVGSMNALVPVISELYRGKYCVVLRWKNLWGLPLERAVKGRKSEVFIASLQLLPFPGLSFHGSEGKCLRTGFQGCTCSPAHSWFNPYNWGTHNK